jgi:hypothetical protein
MHTVGYAGALPRLGGVGLEPLVEIARARVSSVGAGLFRPRDFYGSDVIWSVTAGVRLRLGPPHRMGRYGVLAEHARAGGHAGH